MTVDGNTTGISRRRRRCCNADATQEVASSSEEAQPSSSPLSPSSSLFTAAPASPALFTSSSHLSPLSTSSPLLLRLVHRREHDCSKKSSLSSSAANKRSSWPFALSMALLACIFSLSSFSSVTAQDLDDPVRNGLFAEEAPTATISPSSCPSGCSCFFTLMYCFNLDRVPSVISPATKFVSISNAQFINPVLVKSNFSSGYENVEDISIQYTNLATIQSQAFDNLRRVRYISLDHNQLRTLPAAMLRVFARAKFVSLFSNQWTCNKDLAWLYEVYRSNPDKFGAGCLDADCRLVSQLRCNAPLNFRNLDFVNITFSQYQQMQAS